MERNLYIDNHLPFGLRSAPLLFTALADAAEWIIRQQNIYGTTWMISSSQVNHTQHNVPMASALQAFHELGIPIEPDKSEGQTTTLTVLGIEVDTEEM